VKELLERSIKRFSEDTKIGKLVKHYFSPSGKHFETMDPTFFLPITEFVGNYQVDLEKWFEQNLTVRLYTPRKVKKTQRIRGYRDHGTMVSSEAKIRRSANTEHNVLANRLLKETEHLASVPETRWKVLRRLLGKE
jgi:hypothetical protein